jgi:hypothetical protein
MADVDIPGDETNFSYVCMKDYNNELVVYILRYEHGCDS